MFQNGANIDAKDKYGYSTFDLTDKYKNIKLRDTLQTIKNNKKTLKTRKYYKLPQLS